MGTTTDDQVYWINGEHAADRLLGAQAISSDLFLRGDPPPTPRQVSAVLHALADHTHNARMLGESVKELGRDRQELGDLWMRTTGLGRYFHGLGDWLDREFLDD